MKVFRTSLPLCCGVLAAFVSLPVAIAAASPLDVCKQAWLAGAWQESLPCLLQVRNESYGRGAELDYMIGTAACRLPERREWGARVFDWMLYAYALTPASRTLLERERELCRAPSGATLDSPAATSPTVLSSVSAGVHGVGKTFYWLESSQPVASYAPRVVLTFNPREFQARLFPSGDREKAVAAARERVPNAVASSDGRFVVVSLASHTAEQRTEVARDLEAFYIFLSRQYHVDAPKALITLYLVPKLEDLHTLALKLHGLDVSPATIGYTFRDDQSLVAVTTGTGTGTLRHELFHLAVRSTFGDVPQWLDEGVAALYEVSGSPTEQFRGLRNWRGRVLQALWSKRPTLESLVRSQWVQPESPSGGGAGASSLDELDVAAHLATARYFALYLQEHGTLPDVLLQLREKAGIQGTMSSDPRDRVVQLVEQVVGPLATVQKDFDSWFHKLHPDDSRHDTNGRPTNAPAPNSQFGPFQNR